MKFKFSGVFIILAAVLFGFFIQSARYVAAEKTRVPPVSTYKAMLEVNKEKGWVQFRNYGGKQLIYFTPLQTMHCRLKTIRYSINSKALDKEFGLVPCNPQLPFSLPPDVGTDKLLISLPIGGATTLAVQVVWENGEESEVVVYEPCKDVGEQTCAWPLEE